jgi:hypothetical protein
LAVYLRLAVARLALTEHRALPLFQVAPEVLQVEHTLLATQAALARQVVAIQWALVVAVLVDMLALEALVGGQVLVVLVLEALVAVAVVVVLTLAAQHKAVAVVV